MGIVCEEFSFSNTDLDTLHRHVKSLSNTSSVGVDDPDDYCQEVQSHPLATSATHHQSLPDMFSVPNPVEDGMYIPNSEERGFESSIKLAPNCTQLCSEQASGTSDE